MDFHFAEAPDGLTRRARTFVRSHGLRVESLRVDEHREHWLGLGVPTVEIDRVAAYSTRWGGLALPPAPCYDGGPRLLGPDTPEKGPGDGWWFEAGVQRTAVPYSFMIGPRGEFGIHGDRWVPLHETVEGWVESVALAYYAARYAQSITRLRGDDVDTLRLDGYDSVPEIAGLADTWWRGQDSLVAIFNGETECFSSPRHRTALIYSGLDDWALHG